ncbi:hypothetical protein DNTS_023107 [Danionella cerebrum]|uniref:Death domain-containing protein n=1 Tax=Danionella cerebrum TaxID=2873325 RepID=A0A553MZT8_9TELE|nr:hypothetical protein DNTS_023107 [Danionella translucida]
MKASSERSETVNEKGQRQQVVQDINTPCIKTENVSDFGDGENCEFETVFVLKDFQAPEYSYLYKNDSRILGPPAVMHCASKGEPLPFSSRPLYSMTMLNLSLCFTGFRKKDEVVSLVNLVHHMGGTIRKDFDSTKVTHLIARSTHGEKYRNFSHLEQCQPCTPCSDLMRMLTPCTDANNAVCVCDYGFYYSKVTGRCEACTICPIGKGVLTRCNFENDTLCEECDDDSFSDQETAFDPCLPCTMCELPELELRSCSPVSDAVCRDVDAANSSSSPSYPPTTPYFTPSLRAISTPAQSAESYTDKMPPESPTESVTTADPGLRKLHGLSINLIPIYASILAAVVLGLVAFIIFKRADPSQTPSPEGEKLHSDSGISVDSHSLQEGQGPPHTVVKIDGGSAPPLPLHTREEVEKLLSCSFDGEESGANDETDWCSLAALLGYKDEQIANFKQEERPIQALLSHWSSQDSANIETLCTALNKINREDIVQSIAVKPTATSTV